MVVTVVGYQALNYTNRSGRQVSGHRLYVTYPERNVQGQRCAEVYFNLDAISVIPGIGDVVDIEYNQFGRAIGLRGME